MSSKSSQVSGVDLLVCFKKDLSANPSLSDNVPIDPHTLSGSLEILARIIKFCPRDLHWQPISVKVSLKSSGKLKLGFSSNIFHTMLFLSAIGRTLDHQMLLRREDGEGPP